MAQKKKWTFAIVALGAVGATALTYAFLRAPRHLYDGRIVSCEGNVSKGMITWKEDVPEDIACRTLSLARGSGSGKLYAPFNGRVLSATNSEIVIESKEEPVEFVFRFKGGSPTAPVGPIKSGALIAQAEGVDVLAFRKQGGNKQPMAPSSWLITNAMVPASIQSDVWCEDSSKLIVPKCVDTTFAKPRLPKFSLRSIQVTL